MNGYLRKAQHDENNLNIEVTVEVISDFKVKKASVFNGFKRQTTKSTVSKPLVALHSSPRDNFPFRVYICQKAFLMGRLFVYPGILCSSPGLFTQEFRI